MSLKLDQAIARRRHAAARDGRAPAAARGGRRAPPADDAGVAAVPARGVGRREAARPDRVVGPSRGAAAPAVAAIFPAREPEAAAPVRAHRARSTTTTRASRPTSRRPTAWLKQYFDTRAKPVQALQATLKQLAATPIAGRDARPLAQPRSAARAAPRAGPRARADRARRPAGPLALRRARPPCASCSGSCCSPPRRSRVALAAQAHRRLRAVRRAAVSRRALAQPAARAAASAASSAGYALLRIVLRDARRCRDEVRAFRRRQQRGARARRSTTRRSSRCSKAATARRGSSRRRRSRFPRSPGIRRAGRRARGDRHARLRDGRGATSRGPTPQAPSLAVPRLMLEAEMKLEQGQPLEALGVAAGAAQGGGLAHRRAAARAARAAGRRALRRDSAARRPAGQAQGLRRAGGRVSCAPPRTRRSSPRARTTRRGCAPTGAKLSDAEQRMPKIARAAAKSFTGAGRRSRGRGHPGAEPRARVGSGARRCSTPNAGRRIRTPQLEQAERWLARTTTTRRCCTRSACCASARSCGARRRRTSRRASRSTTPGERASRWASSSRELGRTDEANTQLAAALKLALAELRGRAIRQRPVHAYGRAPTRGRSPRR